MSFTPFIEVQGIDRTQAMLDGAIGAITHMRPALELVADDMMRTLGINFSSEGRRGGGSWAQLDPDWLARKVSYGASPKILQMWGFLLRSMTIRDDEFQRLEVGDDHLFLSSELDYADYMNLGTSNAPARPFANFVEGDLLRWTEICEKYIMDAMRIP